VKGADNRFVDGGEQGVTRASVRALLGRPDDEQAVETEIAGRLAERFAADEARPGAR